VLTGDFFNVSCGRHCLFWSCWQRSRPRTIVQWRWLSGKRRCREGSAPAEPSRQRAFLRSPLRRKNTGKRSQRRPAFSGSAGASLAQVFTRLFTEFQRKPMPLAERWADGCNLPPTAWGVPVRPAGIVG